MSMFQRMIEGDDPQAPGRDAFGMPQYPQDERTAALAARLMASRSPAQQARLQALQQATPETLPPPAPATLTPQQAALMAVGMLPGVGDVVGVGADAYTMATNPEARTPFNALLAAAGLLPFVPSGMGAVTRAVGDAAPVAKKATTQAGRSANGSVAAAEAGSDAGGGLPMDEASRMQRAREMGFTVDAYHGTPRDFDSFKKQPGAHFGFHFGATPDAPNDRLRNLKGLEEGGALRGADIAPVYDEASKLAARQRIVPVQQAIERRKAEINAAVRSRAPDNNADLVEALNRGDMDAVDRLLEASRPAPTVEEAEELAQLDAQWMALDDEFKNFFAHVRPGENIIPAKLRVQNPVRMNDTNWGDPSRVAADNPSLNLPTTSMESIRRELERRGHDGIVYANQVEGVGKDSYVVFDPNQVRSRFAAFDPAKRNSSDLLASMAPAAAAGGAAALYALSPEDAAAMGMTEEEYNALMQYLSGQ